MMVAPLVFFFWVVIAFLVGGVIGYLLGAAIGRNHAD
jgi:membrane protein DedA with SNARE-associated domain